MEKEGGKERVPTCPPLIAPPHRPGHMAHAVGSVGVANVDEAHAPLACLLIPEQV